MTICIAERVNIYAQEYKKEGRGKLFVEYGTPLLLCKKDNKYYLQAYCKEKKYRSTPDFVIPVELIYDMWEGSALYYGIKSKSMRLTIITRHSINTCITDLPMQVVIKLNYAGVDTFLGKTFKVVELVGELLKKYVNTFILWT